MHLDRPPARRDHGGMGFRWFVLLVVIVAIIAAAILSAY
jgi:hypothetical protein